MCVAGFILHLRMGVKADDRRLSRREDEMKTLFAVSSRSLARWQLTLPSSDFEDSSGLQKDETLPN